MKKEDSYVAAYIKIKKQHAVLAERGDTKVKISVATIMTICQKFHDEGFNANGGDGGGFGDIFKNMFGDKL